MKLFDDIFSKLKKRKWWRNNYTPQVFAEINPRTTCFSHCVCWFLQNIDKKIFGWLTPDEVTRAVNSEPYYKYARSFFGESTAERFAGRLNQLWDLQTLYINDMLTLHGEGLVARFYNDIDIFTVVEKLKSAPVIVGTSPIYNGRRLGHIMLAVGYLPDSDKIIIDDPFGDYRNEYRDGHESGGHEIVDDMSNFLSIFANRIIALS